MKLVPKGYQLSITNHMTQILGHKVKVKGFHNLIWELINQFLLYMYMYVHISWKLSILVQ